MLGVPVLSGAIYHAASARRTEVSLDADLRAQTLDALAALRALLSNGVIPPAELKPQCDGCSLRGVCLPEAATYRTPSLFEPRLYA